MELNKVRIILVMYSFIVPLSVQLSYDCIIASSRDPVLIVAGNVGHNAVT